MNLIALYPDLEGSRGEVGLNVGQTLLDQLCDLIVKNSDGRLQSLKITPGSKDRFRIQAELSNTFLHILGAAVLRVLHEDGIVVHITHPVATTGFPSIDG